MLLEQSLKKAAIQFSEQKEIKGKGIHNEQDDKLQYW